MHQYSFFSILGMGAGPSQLGKLAYKLRKLGTFETYNTKEINLIALYYVKIFGIGNGALFRPQIKQKRNTGHIIRKPVYPL